jgi:hypothetical protein
MQRQLDVRVSFDSNRDVGTLGTVGEPIADILQYRQRRRRAERDDLAAAFELGEEENVVDELAHLLDLLPRLGKECLGVGVRKRRRFEQRQEPRQRRAQLVGHCGGETDPQLLIGPCLLHQRRVWPRS